MTPNWLGNDGLWNSTQYQQIKFENFSIVENFLSTPPKTILDIGCGLAFESRFFANKYESELYLLDGDVDENKNKPSTAVDGSYHTTADNFLFYHPLSQLDELLKKSGTKNYKLINCKNIDIDSTIKFDLITSWISCGFHYPVNTYRDLIKKHSHQNTKIIMDLRIRYRKKRLPVEEQGVRILNILNEREKYITAEIGLD